MKIEFDLHKEFLRMQRRMRRMRMNYPGALNTKVSIVLTMLAKQPDLTSNEIAEFLKMDQGNLSRFLKVLSREDYIRLSRSAQDARSKKISLTEKGRNALAEAMRINHYLADFGMRPLTDIERARIGRVFARVSNGLGANPVPQLEGEELFVSEQMRLLRTLGMIGSSYLDSPWDIGTYQLLFVLSELGERSFSDLKQELPIEVTTLSRDISQFCKEGILRKVTDPNQSKGILVSLTAKGRKNFLNQHQTTTSRIAESIREIPEEEIQDLLSLLKLAGTSAGITFDFRKCKNEEDYYIARAFLVEKLVSRREHSRLPAQILPKSNVCVLIERSGVPVGLVAAEGKRVKAIELPIFVSENERIRSLSKVESLLGMRIK
jgi:DNA-binding MarR family transcriptional regulator